jgi:hypothetical protein
MDVSLPALLVLDEYGDAPPLTRADLRGRIAAGYLRCSSDRQIDGDTFIRQHDTLHRALASFGMTLNPDWLWEDEGYSAFKNEHLDKGNLGVIVGKLGLNRDLTRILINGKPMPSEIPAGTPFLVDAFNRLVRKPAMGGGLDLIKALTDKGLIIVTCDDMQVWDSERLNTDDNHGLLAKVNGAYGFSRDIRRWVRSAHRAQRRAIVAIENGQTTHPPSMGPLPGWLRREGVRPHVKYVEIPERVETVRTIYRLAKLGWSASQITRYLNDNIEVHAPWGKRRKKPRTMWHRFHVKQILKDEHVLGYHTAGICKSDGTYHRDRRYRGKIYPQIIDNDLFEEVKAMRQARSKISGRKSATYENLFRGKLSCGCCTGSLRSRGYTPRFVCAKVYEGEDCQRNGYLVSHYEPRILDLLIKHSALVPQVKPDMHEQETLVAQKRGEITNARALVEQLINLNSAVAGTAQAINDLFGKIERLEGEVAKLNREIAHAKAPNSRWTEVFDFIKTHLQGALAGDLKAREILHDQLRTVPFRVVGMKHGGMTVHFGDQVEYIDPPPVKLLIPNFRARDDGTRQHCVGGFEPIPEPAVGEKLKIGRRMMTYRGYGIFRANDGAFVSTQVLYADTYPVRGTLVEVDGERFLFGGFNFWKRETKPVKEPRPRGGYRAGTGGRNRIYVVVDGVQMCLNHAAAKIGVSQALFSYYVKRHKLSHQAAVDLLIARSA